LRFINEKSWAKEEEGGGKVTNVEDEAVEEKRFCAEGKP